MKKGSWIGYLLYYAVVVLFIYTVVTIGADLKKAAQSDFDMSMYATAMTAFNVVFGIIIGIGSLAGTLKESGRLRPNWPKLLLIGLPALLVVLNKMLFFTGIMPIYISDLFPDGADIAQMYTYVEILLGYVLATGLTRDRSTRGRTFYRA